MLVDNSNLRWVYDNTSPWFAGFMLRYNIGKDSNWATGTPMHFGVWIDNKIDLPFVSGSFTVMLRAVDTAGNMSTSSIVQIDIGDILPANVIHTESIVSSPIASEETSAAWGSDDSAAWGPVNADPWPQFFAGLDYFFNVTPSEDTVGARMLLATAIEANSLKTYYRTDSNAPPWGDDLDAAWDLDTNPAWSPMPDWLIWPGEVGNVDHKSYFFYCSMLPGPKQNVITSIDVILDVPDIEEILSDIAIATTGTQLTLTKTFRVIKFIGITLQFNDQPTTGVIVVDKNAAGPSLKALGADALIDARILGY